MPKLTRLICSLPILLGFTFLLHAQIRGGNWVSSHGIGVGVVCNDEGIDANASCAAHVLCTAPPNPIAALDITAFAGARCDNQPVDNSALTSGAVGGMQAIGSAKAVGLWYGRRIRAKTQTADCNGNVAVLEDYTDPFGCNPPPPPPPPCTGCGSCEGCRPAGCQSPIVN